MATPPWHPGDGPDGLWADRRAAARARLGAQPQGVQVQISPDGARLAFRLAPAVTGDAQDAHVEATLQDARCVVRCACAAHARCAAALARARAEGRGLALCPEPVCWHVALVDEALLGHDRDVVLPGAAGGPRPRANPSAAPRLLCARRWAEAVARARALAAPQPPPPLAWCGLSAETAERAFGRVEPHEWQRRALALPGVLDGAASLVFSAPTGAGKSLVAETLLLRALLERHRSALYILPYVALCGEKASRMARALAGSGVAVRRLFGGGERMPAMPRKALGLVVCTFEKAAWLVARLLQEDRLGEVGCVVVDEVHMVAQSDRGALLETLLAKLVFCSNSLSSTPARPPPAPQPPDTPGRPAHAAAPPADPGSTLQLVAMSATVADPERLAAWLRARLFVTDFRPVPLAHAVAVGGELRPVAGAWSGALRLGPARAAADQLAALVQETLDAGGSALVFCGTRRETEVAAGQLAERVRVEHVGDGAARAQLAERVRAIQPSDSQDLLARLAAAGLAFHHGGVAPPLRAAVEGAYRAGLLRVLVATTTLAHGVNLPAARVVVRGVARGRGAALGAAEYAQMAGRAGRPGLDARGEAVLLVETEAHARAALALINSPAPPLASRLADAPDALALDAVASGLARSAADMERVARSTLAAAIAPDFGAFAARCSAALRRLRDGGLLAWRGDAWEATPIGRGVAACGLPVAEALAVARDLAAARRGLMLDQELHLAFLVAPQTGDVAWDAFRRVYNALDEGEARVAAAVGLREGWVLRATRTGALGSARDDAGREQERLCRRLFYAKILCDVTREADAEDLLEKYGAGAGAVADLRERGARVASAACALADACGWDDLRALLQLRRERVAGGCRADLVALTAIRGVGPARARALHTAGWRTPEALAAERDEARVAEALARDAGLPRDAAARVARAAVRGARELAAARAAALREEADALAEAAGSAQTSENGAEDDDWWAAAADAADEAATAALLSARRRHGGEPAPRGDAEPRDAPQKAAQHEEPHCGRVAPLAGAAARALLDEWCAAPARGCGGGRAFFADAPRGCALALPERHPRTVFWLAGEDGAAAARRALLEPDGARAWTVDLKRQLRALHASTIWSAGASGAAAGAGVLFKNGGAADARVAAWLLRPDLAEVSLGGGRDASAAEVEALARACAPDAPEWAAEAADPRARLACACAAAAARVGPALDAAMRRAGVLHAFERVEMPLAALLARMEAHGAPFDASVARELSARLCAAAQALEARARALVGRDFCLANYAEVRGALFDTLRLTPAPGTETRRSVNAAALEAIRAQHPVVAVIMEHRKVVKAEQFCAEHLGLCGPDGRLRARLLHTNTETGRLATEAPNLQCCPRAQCFGGTRPFRADPRAAFRAPPGRALLSADYAQVELRVMAHLSGDEALRALLRSSGAAGDPFRLLAAAWRRVPRESVSESDRAWAKAVCYGIVYGKGAAQLAADLGCDARAAAAAVAEFDALFPALAAWRGGGAQRECAARAPEPHVETLAGRRRYLPRIADAGDAAARARAGRQAVNTACQGGAADIVKWAMLDATRELDARLPGAAALVLQVHDELLWEVDAPRVKQVAAVAAERMQAAAQRFGLSVPLPVRLRAGPSWGELEDIVV